MFIPKFDPKTRNWILFDCQTEHISDKAFYEGPYRGPQGSNFLSKHNYEVHWSNDDTYHVWSKLDEKCRGSGLLKEFELITQYLYWTLTPKPITRILFDLQSEHISDKAWYLIGFILTWYLKESSVLKFDLIYHHCGPSWGHWRSNVLSKHTSIAHWHIDHIYQLW